MKRWRIGALCVNILWIAACSMLLVSCEGPGRKPSAGKGKTGATAAEDFVAVTRFHIAGSHENVIPTTEKELAAIDTGEEEEVVQTNNNRINGSFLYPYQKGYLLNVRRGKAGEQEDTVVFCDGEGQSEEQSEWTNIVDIQDNIIYYYSPEGRLTRAIGGKTTVFEEMEDPEDVFFARDSIYYTLADEDKEQSYIYKVDYEGKNTERLYQLDVLADQIYLYQDRLWLAYEKFYEPDSKPGLAVIDMEESEINVYQGIHPEEFGGGRFSVNNGYLYFNSSGLRRLCIQDNSVESIFAENGEKINFTDNGILFASGNKLYFADSSGIKEIKDLGNEGDGFGGIRVEDGNIYIQSYKGTAFQSFFRKVSQIDEEGKAVGELYEDSDQKETYENPIDEYFLPRIEFAASEATMRGYQDDYRGVWRSEFQHLMKFIRKKCVYGQDREKVQAYEKNVRDMIEKSKEIAGMEIANTYDINPDPPKGKDGNTRSSSWGNGTRSRLNQLEGEMYRDASMSLIDIFQYKFRELEYSELHYE